jgi:hypothetical protein
VNEVLNRFLPLQEELEALINSPDAGRQRFPYSYGYFPSILGSLKQLQDCLVQEPIDMGKCRLYAGGLGRLVLEYTDFPESALGKQLLWLATDIITMTEGSNR